MARCKVLGRYAGVLALVFVMLSAALLFSSNLGPRDQSENRAITMQTWPSGTIVVNVTDDAGRPLAGAIVKTVGDGISWQNATPANGTVILRDVTAGEPGTPIPYRINATASGFRDSYPVDISLLENETAYVDLMVYGGSISGTVTTTSGGPSRPIEGANVTVVGLGYSVVVSPTDGSYQISGIPSGAHSVTANASGFVPSSEEVMMPLGGDLLVNFVLISQNGSISGYVYHATLLTPLNNTNVSVQIGFFIITVMSGSDGSYNLTSIPEGTYTLTASTEGFFSGTITDVVVTRGNRTDGKDFFLDERPTRLYGVVRSGTLLLVGANITVVGTTYYNNSGPDGNFQIVNITAGTYTVEVSLSGYDTAVFEGVVIPVGGETQLNVNMTGLPGGIISGIVIDSVTGAPLSNVVVTIVGIDPPRASVYTDINGGFGLPGLAAGNYTIRFEKAGYRPIEITHIAVLKDETTTQNIELMPLRKGFEGFIFGFDMAHSMMILALFLTIVILAMAVYLRIRTFQAPETAPAVYDTVEQEEAEKKTVQELEKSAGEAPPEPGPDDKKAPKKS